MGVTQQHSEPTLLVQYLLANLTGTTVNITQDNCQNQREGEDDKESKHVRFTTVCIFLKVNLGVSCPLVI